MNVVVCDERWLHLRVLFLPTVSIGDKYRRGERRNVWREIIETVMMVGDMMITVTVLLENYVSDWTSELRPGVRKGWNDEHHELSVELLILNDDQPKGRQRWQRWRRRRRWSSDIKSQRQRWWWCGRRRREEHWRWLLTVPSRRCHGRTGSKAQEEKGRPALT